jgi:hypothetical protein
VTDTYSGKKHICNLIYPIYNFDQGIGTQDYSLPFAFNLPSNIPGSFEYSSGTTLAKIGFKFHAKLMSGSNVLVKGKDHIHIRQPILTARADIVLNRNAVMKTWCCVSKGQCGISAVLQKDVYCPSEHADFSVEIDNSASKLTVESVQARLYYTIRLKDGSGRTHLVKGMVLDQKIPCSLKPGGVARGGDAVFSRLELATKRDVMQNVFTANGDLVECAYTIELEANMDGNCMCCGDYPRVGTEVRISPDLVIVPVVPAVPAGWSPVMLQHAELSYDPRYEDHSKKVS